VPQPDTQEAPAAQVLVAEMPAAPSRNPGIGASAAMEPVEVAGE
jgi:hypothetical protein